MASVKEQLAQKVLLRLEAVRAALDWQTVLRNPRTVVGSDQMNAIVMMDGGEPDPAALTGHVEERRFNFWVGMIVVEPTDESATFEQLLDAGYVAIVDALIDPENIQFDGLAVGIDQGEVGEPGYGQSEGQGRIVAGQALEFSIKYWSREGDASAVGP